MAITRPNLTIAVPKFREVWYEGFPTINFSAGYDSKDHGFALINVEVEAAAGLVTPSSLLLVNGQSSINAFQYSRPNEDGTDSIKATFTNQSDGSVVSGTVAANLFPFSP